MKIRVHRTTDTELIRSIVTDPRAFEVRAEDGYTVEDVQVVIDPRIYWVALVVDDTTIGVVTATPLSRTVLDFHVTIKPEFWRQSVNVKIVRLAATFLLERTDAAKLNATVPVSAQPVIRFLQRVGFKREGINRASFRHKGELVDQCYLGFTEASLGE